jgi:hypothetical protein
MFIDFKFVFSIFKIQKNIMKKHTLPLIVFFCLIAAGFTRAQYYGGYSTGAVRPMIAVQSGDIAGLKGKQSVRIIYDYSSMSVGAFRNEQDFINKKVEEYNKKDPEKGEKFKQSWYNSRKERYEPKFEELFNKTIEKTGMIGKNDGPPADVTLTVKTAMTEPGFNVGIARMPAYIDVECTFADKEGKEIVRYFVKNATGAQAMGFDYDAGSRLTESYAKAAKMLAKDVTKRLKKIK